MPALTKEQEKRKEALIRTCRETQGEYVPAHHGPGSLQESAEGVTGGFGTFLHNPLVLQQLIPTSSYRR